MTCDVTGAVLDGQLVTVTPFSHRCTPGVCWHSATAVCIELRCVVISDGDIPMCGLWCNGATTVGLQLHNMHGWTISKLFCDVGFLLVNFLPSFQQFYILLLFVPPWWQHNTLYFPIFDLAPYWSGAAPAYPAAGVQFSSVTFPIKYWHFNNATQQQHLSRQMKNSAVETLERSLCWKLWENIGGQLKVYGWIFIISSRFYLTCRLPKSNKFRENSRFAIIWDTES